MHEFLSKIKIPLYYERKTDYHYFQYITNKRLPIDQQTGKIVAMSGRTTLSL